MNPSPSGERPFDQSGFDVRFDWGLEGLMSVGPMTQVVVIVDVLSFTTCVDVVASRGAVVLPYPGANIDAAEYAATHDAVLAGHRNGDEEMWSLSPASLQTIPKGTKLVLPSPNGSTLSFRAAEMGVQVMAGCVRNASAVAAAAIEVGPPIAVIAAGERWDYPDSRLRVAVEDLIGAGAIIASLSGLGTSPEAESARSAFNSARSIPDALRSSGSGRELIERGFGDDIEIAAAHNVSDSVPVLLDRAFAARSQGAPVT